VEREGTGTKSMAANCEGSQSPPKAVELRRRREPSHLKMDTLYTVSKCMLANEGLLEKKGDHLVLILILHSLFPFPLFLS
jgi:hypothetical protein